MADSPINLKTAMKQFTRMELLQTGATGSGKTTRVLSATRFGPLFIMDFDSKLTGAARNLPDTQKELVFFESLKDKDYNYALNLLKRLKSMSPFPYASICVDTFTMLNEKIYIETMGAKLEKATKADYEIWGAVDNKLLNFFNLLVTLPCNIIINAHVGVGETPDGRETLGVAGRGGFRHKLAPRIVDCHYLYLRDGKYLIKAKNSESVPANSNFPDSFYDAAGNLKVSDLSVFDDYAFRTRETR